MLVMPCRKLFHFNSPVITASNTHSPYLSQGVAQAVEDAIAITAVLSVIQSKDQLPAALKAYEMSRKSRAVEIQAATTQARQYAIRKDGEVKEARGKEPEGASDTVGSEDVVKIIRSTWVWDAAEAARTTLSGILKSG
jgi:salicylate hydroxylase